MSAETRKLSRAMDGKGPNAKKRIRGPNLAVFAKNKDGLAMEDALAKADEKGLVIASSKRLSQALEKRHEWESIGDVFSCWTGTMAAHDKPDQKLGKEIEYIDPKTGIRYIFPVPEQCQGQKNIVLVTEHPDFTIEKDGETRIIQAKEIGFVDRFPIDREWYPGDGKYDIPRGDKSRFEDINARYLWRIEKSIGLIVRGDFGGGFGCIRRYVILGGDLSYPLGVAVESPARDSARE